MDHAIGTKPKKFLPNPRSQWFSFMFSSKGFIVLFFISVPPFNEAITYPWILSIVNGYRKFKISAKLAPSSQTLHLTVTSLRLALAPPLPAARSSINPYQELINLLREVKWFLASVECSTRRVGFGVSSVFTLQLHISLAPWPGVGILLMSFGQGFLT